MAATHPAPGEDARFEPALRRRYYKVGEVEILTDLARPTIYQKSSEDPERWGRVQFGRAVRFLREKIDVLVREGAA